MEFSILDRITAWVPGRWIRAEKHLRPTEPYLPDHFPGTPVLPGVLILEGMIQAGECLLDLSEPGPRRNYKVESFRGVKFMRFVQPGETLQICSQLVDFRKPDGPVEFLCQGELGGRMAISARIRLTAATPQERSPEASCRFRNTLPFSAAQQILPFFSPENGQNRSETFRWFWIDRFVDFQSGSWAEACKQVPTEIQSSHFGRLNPARLAPTLILEGMAQTGGLLAFDATGFQLAPIMARIPQAEFYFEPLPGDMLTYHAHLDRLGPDAAAVTITSQQADRLQAKTQILFALVGNGADAQPKVDPAIFYRMMCQSAAFEVPTEGRPVPLSDPLPLGDSLSSSGQ